MNKKTAKKKFYFLGFTLLFVALLLSSCGSKPTASWAEDAVKKIPELQSLPAYQKELDLEEPLSRGEAAVILNGLLNYKTASINCYVDLEDKYYKDALLKLTAAELISGDKEGKIRPEEPLTLKEGIASLAKLLSVEDKDIDSLYAAGSFKESQKDNQLTRGEFIQLLNGCVENLYNKPEEVSNKEYKNFVLVTSDNVNFSQCSFDKPVLLAPGVEEKTITFKDCTNGKTLAIKDGTVTKEDAPFRFKIASFDTKFDPTMINRSINLKLALGSINNTIVPPGGEFSFNRATGKKTYDVGYKDGIVVAGGKLVPGFAGGVCQVSSTVFNAALESGTKILERHAHALEFSYVPQGRDATIFEGSQDLRFQNPYPVPIQVQTNYNENGVITVGIYAQGYMKLPKITLDTVNENGTYITKRYLDGNLEHTHKTKYSGFGF